MGISIQQGVGSGSGAFEGEYAGDLYANWSSKPCSKLFYWLHIIAILQQDLRMRWCLGGYTHPTDCLSGSC